MKALKIARRGCCGCLMFVILGLLALGCALALSLWNVAVASADGANAIRLNEAIAESPRRTMPAGVFYEHEVIVTFDGAEVWLASTPDGRGEIVTDDRVKLLVIHPDGSQATWQHDFRSADQSRIVPLPATELKELFEVGQNRVKITLTDVRSFTYSSSAYYLVIQSSEGRVDAPIRPTITMTATMTATPTEIAPTMTATPIMTATPTELAHDAPTPTPTTTPLNKPTIKGRTAVAPTITATAALSGTTVTTPNAFRATVNEPTKSPNQWPTWLILIVIVIVVGLWCLLRRRQLKEALPQTRLMGWLEGMDCQTGDVLPLVNLSVYPKGAAIVANPLRVIGLGAEIEEIEEQVIAELQPTPSGVPELVIEADKKGLMAEEVQIGTLQLEYRNPFVVWEIGDWGLEIGDMSFRTAVNGRCWTDR